MAQIKGVDILVNIGTIKVGGQRGATLNRSAETMETTNKDSAGFREYEQSFKDWTVEADGLFIDGDAGFTALEDAYMGGTKVEVQVAMPSGVKYTGQAIVTELPIEAPYDDMATYTITLQGSGLLTKQPVI